MYLSSAHCQDPQASGSGKTSQMLGYSKAKQVPILISFCSIQPALEPFQGWGIQSFSGQPLPGCDNLATLTVKDFFLISNLNLLFQ